MLSEQKPDGVMVCTGPAGHATVAKQVLRLGYPVYTEKPPAMTAQDALEVAQVAQETGLLCTTAFKKRYNVAYSRAREWISKFPESDLYSISIDYCSSQFPNNTPTTVFLFDFTIHVIDLTRYLFGEVDEVFAYAKGLDAYAVALRFKSGAVGSLNLNDGRTLRVPTEEVEITAKGGNFMTIHNSSVWRITENEQPTEWREPPTFISAGDSGHETGHLAEIIDFSPPFAKAAPHAPTSTKATNQWRSMKPFAIHRKAESPSKCLSNRLHHEPYPTLHDWRRRPCLAHHLFVFPFAAERRGGSQCRSR
jgi:predicted dehydrogenase